MQVMTRNQNLKYLGFSCVVSIYNNGLEVWNDLDAYLNGFQCRNRAIIRIDAIQLITDLFSKDILLKYRKLIWLVVSGINGDVNFVSNVLTQLMRSDKVFADRLREFYYCCDRGNMSFGEYVLSEIANEILSVVDKYRIYFRGRTESVYCCSEGYIYISIDDSDNYIHLPDKDIKVEVMSYAKNWKGLIA